MVNPGDFRHLVSIVGPGTRTADGAGGWTDGAAVPLVENVWAMIEGLTGTEQLRAMQTAAQASHRVTLREWYEGVTAGMWVTFEGRTLRIVAPPVDPDERRSMLVLMTREET